MDVVTVRQPLPVLRRPVLLAAFRGWNDAGDAASSAVDTLRRQLRAKPFASIDSEEFFDYQVTRPTVRIIDGGSRRIEWPSNRFFHAALPDTDRDIVFLSGSEPNFRWRAFTRGIVDLARQLGVELVVTLGAMQVDLPHTHAVPVTGSTSDPALAGRLGLRRSTYEGPTGITGVLHHTSSNSGLSAVSLWAGIPHYLASTSYLTGTLALAEHVLELLDVGVPLDRLRADAESQRSDIAEIVAEDSDLAEYVSELEQRADVDEDDDDVDELPEAIMSGEELAAEFERYLRERRDG